MNTLAGTTSVYVAGYLTNNTANANAAVFRGKGLRVGTAPQAGASATTSADVLVARYVDSGPAAILTWTQVGGGPGPDAGQSIALTTATACVAGYATSAATFSGLSLPGPARDGNRERAVQ